MVLAVFDGSGESGKFAADSAFLWPWYLHVWQTGKGEMFAWFKNLKLLMFGSADKS